MKIKKLSLLALLAIPFMSIAGGDVLEIGAKANALGGATVTLSDVWSANNNQAGLAGVENIEAGLYYNNLNTPGANLIGLAAAYPTQSGVFGLGLSNYGISGVYTQMKASLSFGKKLNEKFNIGAALDVMQLSQGENLGNKTNLTFELGFQYKLTEELTVAGHLFNPARALIIKDSLATNREYIPTDIKLGLSYKFSDKVTVVTEAFKTSDQSPTNVFAEFKAGVDYKLNEAFFIRTAISSNEFKNHFGIGYQKDGLKVDIAAVNQFNLGFYPTFSLSYEIK